MRRIAYQFLAATNSAHMKTGTSVPPSRAPRDCCVRPDRLSTRYRLFGAILATLLVASTVTMMISTAMAETRPHYGGTLRIMMQSAPNTLELPANATPIDYWAAARTLALVGDTLVGLDAQGRAQPALAIAWQSDPAGRHWQFTLRHGVKFHDGSPASPAAVAQILGAIHPSWSVRASGDSILIESDAPMPSLPAELALPRNLLLKRNATNLAIGTGAFVIAEWQPGKLLKLAANEENWSGRSFVDAVEIEFGRSLRDQAIALELNKADVIESPPQALNGSLRHNASSSSSLTLPVELLALVFPPNSRARDPRVREALALAIDRKPIQAVLLKGVGEPAAAILPNWMTGYDAVFSAQVSPQRARNVVADSQQPILNLSYDPRDPQAQLISERIALNAREVGVTVQVSLSGESDIRLMRVVLPSPDPATSLGEAVRQLGLPQLAVTPHSNSLDELYQAERGLLDGYSVIPLFHLPLATTASARVLGWEPGRLGQWDEPRSSLADAWLSEGWLADSRPQTGPR
jgi:peptide/nickel transport system substrate-binding protein